MAAVAAHPITTCPLRFSDLAPSLMLIFNYGSTYFLDKVALTKFIIACRMVWDLVWGTTLCFHKSKTEKAKRGGKSAIQPILCWWLSLTVVSTPPPSMVDSIFAYWWTSISGSKWSHSQLGNCNYLHIDESSQSLVLHKLALIQPKVFKMVIKDLVRLLIILTWTQIPRFGSK